MDVDKITADVAAKPLRLLVVEDSPRDAEIVVREIRRGGFDVTWKRVETAETMRAALDAEPWDVIVSDYRMPNFDGLQALLVFQEKKADIPFIIVSGAIGEETAIAIMKAGANDYIMKGNLSRLAPAIERELKDAESRRKRKSAEEALHESDAKIRHLMEVTPLPLCYVNKDGVITFRNSRFVEVFGYTDIEVPNLAEWWLKAYPDAQYRQWVVQNWESVVSRAAETGDDIESEDYRVTCKDGNIRDIIISGAVIEDNFLATFFDITERKRMEDALRESEERYRKMFHEAHAVMLIIDPHNALIIDANPAACTYYGWSREDLLNKKIDEINTLSTDEIRSEMKLALTEKRNYFFFKHRLSGGSIRDVEVYSAPIEIGGKKLLFSIVHDITERRQHELHSQRTTRTLRTLSASNEALIRCRDEEELLRKVAEIPVRVGGYMMAWVGYAEQDPNKSIRIMARYGTESNYLHQVSPTWGDDARGQGPTGMAVKTGKTQVNREFATNPAMVPWRELALRAGFGSSISLPLNEGESTFGALIIYAHEPNAFDDDEVALLQELANNLGYGITSLRSGIERQKAAENLRTGLVAMVGAMATTVETRDPYTAGHQRRVAELSTEIAQEMGLSQTIVEGVHFGAIIHDIGKLQVPAEILARPTQLTGEELDLVHEHAEAGWEILRGINFPWPIADIIRQHHERLDGSGYPLGLKGDQISLEAQIVAVADVVEAMCSHRPYRRSLGVEAALKEISEKREQCFNPGVVDVCITLLREKRFSFTS